MKIPRRRRAHRPTVVVLLFGVVLIGGVLGVSAANSVPATKADNDSRAIATDDLAHPVRCPTRRVRGAQAVCAARSRSSCMSTFSGTNGADLITGSAGVDTISGLNGNDCILGGGAADSLNGGGGTDVCIGGAGVDTFLNCETATQ